MERTKGAELWLALMLSSVTPGSLLLNGGTGKFGIWFCSQGKLEFMAELPAKPALVLVRLPLAKSLSSLMMDAGNGIA